VRNTKWLKNGKFRKAILSAFYNISQRNFGILLILWCSFKLWWNFCLDQNFSYKGKGPLTEVKIRWSVGRETKLISHCSVSLPESILRSRLAVLHQNDYLARQHSAHWAIEATGIGSESLLLSNFSARNNGDLTSWRMRSVSIPFQRYQKLISYYSDTAEKHLLLRRIRV
jgi:hypothetical protein